MEHCSFATCSLEWTACAIKKRIQEQWTALTLTVGHLEHSKRIRGVCLAMVRGSTWTGIVNIDRLSQRIIVALPDFLRLLQEFLCNSGFPSKRDDGLSRQRCRLRVVLTLN